MGMRKEIRGRIVPSIVAMCACGMVLLGQTMSQLGGRITDPSGGVVPGVEATATNADTGVSTTATTTAEGYYVFPYLPPGPYTVTVQQEGFRTFTQEGLVLETGFKRTLDIELTLGSVNESVTVTAQTVLVEKEDSTVGQLIEPAFVRNMPISNRRGAELVRLSGNVVSRGSGDLTFSIGGGRGGNQMWLLDGTSAQQVQTELPEVAMNPPAEALQELKVETNNFSAEYGRAGGGVVVMTTRSGTNEFHGAVYEFLRNDALDSRSFFAPTKPPLRYNVFGGSLGGPIIKDKTFFFFNYEGARRRTPNTSFFDVPNPPEVLGDFSNRLNLTVIDPLSGDPFPNNIIPAERMDPVGQAVANLYPVPNRGTLDLSSPPANNYVAVFSGYDDANFYTSKVDHHFNHGDRVAVRYMYERANRGRPNIWPNGADMSLEQRTTVNHNLTGNWTHPYSPTAMNEFRINYGSQTPGRVNGGSSTGFDRTIGFDSTDPEHGTRFTPAGYSGVGGSRAAETPRYTRHLINNVTWLKGKHHIKTGFEFRGGRNLIDSTVDPGGLGFARQVTGDGLASLLLGRVFEGDSEGSVELFQRIDTYGAFIQDDWKITSKLTLNIGVRWELETPLWDEQNRMNNFDLDAVNPVSNTPGVITFVGRDGLSKYLHDFDKNNFGPRLGLAWQTRGGFVIRSGYAIHYTGNYRQGFSGDNNVGFAEGVFDVRSPDGGRTPAFFLRDGLPAFPNEPLTSAFGAVPVGESPRLAAYFIPKDHVSGYAQHWNFGIQKQLWPNTVFEIGYLANAGRKLTGEAININVVPLVNERGPEEEDQALRRIPQFDDVYILAPADGNSIYHGMNVKLERRYSQGLNLLTTYTWSKYIDDMPARGEVAGEEWLYQHPELRHLDRALAGNDIRHRLMGSAVWDLPIGRGRPVNVANQVLNQIIGGWGIGAIVELQSGMPFGVVMDENTSNTFSDGLRPNLLRDPLFSGGRPKAEKIDAWFDTSAFGSPGAGEFGNSPRLMAGGPGYVSVDLSIYKSWNFGERYRLQFRTDWYNLPNHTSFANPATTVEDGDFGQISDVTNSGRRLQMNLRFEF